MSGINALVVIIFAWLFPVALVNAQALSYTEQLLEDYSEMMIGVSGPKEVTLPLGDLLSAAERYRDANPHKAEAWMATGRIRCTQGLIRARGILAQAKNDMEKAIELNSNTNEGITQALLGYLYLSAPGWPISFGNDERGRALQEEAMKINSISRENNYFYALGLLAEKNITRQLIIYNLL